MIYNSETPSEAALAAFYARLEKYDPRTVSSQPGVASADEERARAIAAALRQWWQGDLNKQIIDLGTGTGSLPHALAELGFTHVLGLDPGLSRSAEIAFQRGKVSIRPGGIAELALETDANVTLCHVLEHLVSPTQALVSIWQAQTTGSEIYVEVPDADRYREFPVTPFHYFDIEHINHFGLRTLADIAQRAGYQLRGGGRKEVAVTTDFVYPAIWVRAVKDESAVSRWTCDEVPVPERLDEYIRWSRMAQSGVSRAVERVVETYYRSQVAGRRYFVFGCGAATGHALALSHLSSLDLEGFVDNSRQLHGKRIGPWRIIAPSSLPRDAVVLVPSKLHLGAVRDQLAKLDRGLQVVALF